MSTAVEHRVSIIIPNWNGGEIVSECIESILHHTRSIEFELVIVDNGSTDGSEQKIRGLAEGDTRIRMISNEQNLLFAHACNQGYEISKSRHVLIANNDILLRNDAVTALVNYASDHPTVGAVTPRFVDREGQPQEFVRRLPNALHVLAHYHTLGRVVDRLFLRRHFQNSYFYRDRTFQQAESIEQAGASFSLFRRDALDQIGGLFDERFPLLFNDVDLYRRIKESGFSSHVVPSIEVVHLGGISSRRFDSTEYLYHQFRGQFDYFKKHHPLQYPLLCLAWPLWYLKVRRSANATMG